MAWRHVPAHVNEATEPVDNIGGVLSAVMIGALVVGLNFITVPEPAGRSPSACSSSPPSALVLFVAPPAARARTRSTTCRIAARRTFWVAAVRRHHRLRLADGHRLHQPAVPPERARLRHAPGGGGDPARGRLHGPRRAALGEARPRAWARASRCCSGRRSWASPSSACSSCGARARPTGSWPSRSS